MLTFEHVTPDNTGGLEEFLREYRRDPSRHFTYFDTREPSCIQTHALTVVAKESDSDADADASGNARVVAYGHIDAADGVHWIGLCALRRGAGFGRRTLEYLIRHARHHALGNLKLSVHVDNWIALRLYLGAGFVVERIEGGSYFMRLPAAPLLEVSLGEAADKLTILDIKADKIADARRADVEVERRMLRDAIGDRVGGRGVRFYYDTLKSINLAIWEMQDEFRYSPDADKPALCMRIIEENDRRFRVKRKINNLCNSHLREQKGYTAKRAFMLSHFGLGDSITHVSAARYLATKYDQVIVVCKRKSLETMREVYSDDDSIRLFPVGEVGDISPRHGYSMDAFKRITAGMDIYMGGAFVFHKRHRPFDTLPYNFYEDMGISPKVYWRYFHIPRPAESAQLRELLRGKKYAFVHRSCSTSAHVFDTGKKLAQFGFADALVIDPDANAYPADHPHHAIAQQFIMRPLAHYIDTLIHADIVIVTDSCYYCLAMQLPLKTEHRYLVSRNEQRYDHIYSAVSGYTEGVHPPKFTQIERA
jgi:ribosomal protein S18 acetylase RimI-like enzyme